MSCPSPTIPCSLPSPHTFANSSPSSQHALLDYHPLSPFLDPPSLLISCFPTEPYQSLHHVFGMTYHLNSAPFLRLHRRHCQSQDIIFIRLLYSGGSRSSTKGGGDLYISYLGLVFSRTVRYFGPLSSVRMIVIPDNASVNSSIFVQPTLTLSMSGNFERATWQPYSQFQWQLPATLQTIDLKLHLESNS